MSMSNVWTLLVLEVMSEKAGIAKAPGKGLAPRFRMWIAMTAGYFRGE
jgi:hypothetical protein